MSRLDALFRSNPMRIEIARFRRRFLGANGPVVNKVAIGLAALCYVGLVMLVASLKGDMPPIALIMFQTGLFCFFGPSMLHGAIAGERERRSWDLLMVAPITKGQIVAGKFMGALAALGVGAAAMAVPIALSAFFYDKTTFYDLLLAEGASLAFCVLVCAWTIFVSARTIRSFTALGVTLGSLAVSLIVAPMLLVSIFATGSDAGKRLAAEWILYANPFTALTALAQEPGRNLYDPEQTISRSFYGLPHALLYLGLALALLLFAERTLRRADA